MKNKLPHSAFHIDDIKRPKKFYEGDVDWGLNSYGQAARNAPSALRTLTEPLKK